MVQWETLTPLIEQLRQLTFAPLLAAVGVWSGALPYQWTLALTLTSALVIGHIVLRQKSAPSAIGWIGAIVLSPILGLFLYVLFGVNRIQRKAAKVRRRRLRRFGASPELDHSDPDEAPSAPLLASLNETAKRIGSPAFEPGNHLKCLSNGDEAFPAMLDAIRSAKRWILLQSYIFDHDRVGKEFVEALAQAQKRGVEVRVLVDDVGKGMGLNHIVRASLTFDSNRPFSAILSKHPLDEPKKPPKASDC